MNPNKNRVEDEDTPPKVLKKTSCTKLRKITHSLTLTKNSVTTM